jgi:hypothetical protein
VAKKAKKAKKSKKAKAKAKQKLWCTEDLDFDEDGNLLIKNRALAYAVCNAIYRTDRRFRIRIEDMDLPGVYDKMIARAAKKGDPLDGKATPDEGRPPMDAMCPC